MAWVQHSVFSIDVWVRGIVSDGPCAAVLVCPQVLCWMWHSVTMVCWGPAAVMTSASGCGIWSTRSACTPARDTQAGWSACRWATRHSCVLV